MSPSSTTATTIITSSSYNAAEQWCYQVVAQGHDMLFDAELYQDEMYAASARFHFPIESLQSFLRHIHLIHVKKSAYRVKAMTTKSTTNNNNKKQQFSSSMMPQLLDEYQRKGISIPVLAKRINFPPYLLARYMVDAMIQSQARKVLADAMRYPELKLTRNIMAPEYLPSEEQFYHHYHNNNNNPQYYYNHDTYDNNKTTNNNNKRPKPTTRLAMEVRRAIDMDPIYGPQSDQERHLVGVEFEVVLEQELNKLGIPFETEAQLRQRGASRTPDVLLSFPVGVQVPMTTKTRDYNNTNNDNSGDDLEWKMVCWIDSKALFGDVNTHHTSVLPQLETYVHRFGPGLVLYWFGHAPLERLADAQGDVVIVGWDLPQVFLFPDGTLVSSANKHATLPPPSPAMVNPDDHEKEEEEEASMMS